MDKVRHTDAEGVQQIMIPISSHAASGVIRGEDDETSFTKGEFERALEKVSRPEESPRGKGKSQT